MYLHFGNKRESSRKHVRVQFLSTRRAKIYESTHAYFDEKICSHILFTNETQVAHLWEYNVFCSTIRDWAVTADTLNHVNILVPRATRLNL